MSLLWSLVTVAGLVILVYRMFTGVPRDLNLLTTAGTGAPKVLLPAFGALLTVSGITGYLSMRWLGFTPSTRVGMAIGVGLIAAFAARWFVQFTFAVPSVDPEDDPRYQYQGHIASITQPITANHPGRVAFTTDSRQITLSALSTDGMPVPAGTEVVIERIDDNLATVELWAAVEQRL